MDSRTQRRKEVHVPGGSAPCGTVRGIVGDPRYGQPRLGVHHLVLGRHARLHGHGCLDHLRQQSYEDHVPSPASELAHQAHPLQGTPQGAAVVLLYVPRASKFKNDLN